MPTSPRILSADVNTGVVFETTLGKDFRVTVPKSVRHILKENTKVRITVTLVKK